MNIVIKKFEELSIDELYELLKIRVNVFVVEQKCPYPEVDDRDKHAYHVYIQEGGEVKAYLRVLEAGVSFDEVSIGRVLTTERGKGYANILLKEGINVAREKLNADKIKIEAQTYAKRMYEKFGFKVVSDEFLEDGIPHVQMILDMSKNKK